MTDSPPSPRERASHLINAYAHKSAILEAATGETKAQIAALTAALNKASAAHIAELEQLEAEAKQLALEHGLEIFGPDKRTLQENGFVLALRETAAVQVEDEFSAIRMLLQDASRSTPGSDTAMACNACVRVTCALDREYIMRHYNESPQWFVGYGISVVDKVSASLKPAPKPRTKKASKLKAAEQAEEQEAA